MTGLSIRHILGLILAAALTLAIYFFWYEGLNFVRGLLRMSPGLRNIWVEFGALTTLLFTVTMLTLAQLIWDKLPSKDDE